MAAVVPILADCDDEYYLLARRVQPLFNARGFLIPDIEDCIPIAHHLRIVRDRDPEAELHYLRLVKYGYAFLRELAAVQPRWAGWEAGAEDAAWMARVSKEIEAFLSLVDWTDIGLLAMLAQKAWGRANRGKYPRSTERNAPLCRLIVGVLGEAGINLSPATVSAVLQGKRRPHSNCPMGSMFQS